MSGGHRLQWWPWGAADRSAGLEATGGGAARQLAPYHHPRAAPPPGRCHNSRPRRPPCSLRFREFSFLDNPNTPDSLLFSMADVVTSPVLGCIRQRCYKLPYAQGIPWPNATSRCGRHLRRGALRGTRSTAGRPASAGACCWWRHLDTGTLRRIERMPSDYGTFYAAPAAPAPSRPPPSRPPVAARSEGGAWASKVPDAPKGGDDSFVVRAAALPPCSSRCCSASA
jgi:hypothetical protein